MILRRFIYYCGKFHLDTIDQTVFEKEFVKLVWGKWKLFRATLTHARFWDAYGNRKWAIFTFNLASHNHIHIPKYLFSIKDE